MADIPAAQRRLDAARDRKRRRALGPALAWDDGALDQLVAIGPADVESAAALWRREAGSLGGLVDAELADDGK
jgi:lysozyme family protein